MGLAHARFTALHDALKFEQHDFPLSNRFPFLTFFSRPIVTPDRSLSGAHPRHA